MKNDRSVIINAFSPGAAIELPAMFAGRSTVIAEALDALHATGSCPIIYGERGVGKSSIAVQIERIALGDVELVDKYKLNNRSLSTDDLFVTFYLACTDDIKTKDQLLQRIVNMSQGFRDKESLPRLTHEATKIEHKISLKIYEARVEQGYRIDDRLSKYISLSVEEKFQACVEAVVEEERRKVLIIIDELDRVADTAGLASVIKSMSSKWLKFILVGVAHSISTLLKDHNSIERTLLPIPVRRMPTVELLDLITNVETYLATNDHGIKFTPAARELLVSSADGSPWFVHVLGREALIAAYDVKRILVDAEHVTTAIQTLAKNRYARQFEDAYLRAVGNSRPREIVLRLFAKWTGPDIPTSEIYKIAHALSIPNPSIYVKDLCSSNRGRVLTKAPFEDRHYSFTNTMFRTYIRLRNSVYINVQKHVDEKWKELRSST